MSMKKVLLVTVTTMASFACYAQAEKNNLSVAVDFKELTSLGRMQTTGAFQSYKSTAVNGSQFYINNWSPGTVTTNNNIVIDSYLFLYDKIKQELFMRPKDTDFVVQADKSQVKAFTLTKGTTHLFVPAATYDAKQAGNFFEVLAQGNYTLLKLTKTRFEKADYTDMLKVKQGDMNDSYVDDITYYLYRNNNLEKINLKENAVRKVLKDQSAKVDSYLSQHENEAFSEEVLTGLVNALN